MAGDPPKPPAEPPAEPSAAPLPPRHELATPWRVHAVLVLVVILFGSHFVFSKVVLRAIEPRAWVFYRLALASLVLVPIALWRARRWPPVDRWPAFIVACLLGIVFNQILFTEGLQRTSPAHSSMINALIPLLTLLVAVAVRQERLTGARIAAVVLGATGVFVLVPTGSAEAAAAAADGVTLTGDLLTLANATSYSAFLVLMRRLSPHSDALASTAVFFGVGTVFAALWAWPALSVDSARALVRPDVWPSVLVVVLGATVLAYLLNIWALRRAPSSLVALYVYMQPAVAASLGVAMGLRAPGPAFYGAAVLILAALVVQIRASRSARSGRS